jgi:hypothetical protein
MAVRLSADLGLHLDLNDQYRSGMLSQRDIDVRRTTFWGVFIHDKFVLCCSAVIYGNCSPPNLRQYVESIRRQTLGNQHSRYLRVSPAQGVRRSEEEAVETLSNFQWTVKSAI